MGVTISVISTPASSSGTQCDIRPVLARSVMVVVVVELLARTPLEVVDLLMADDGIIDIVEVALEVVERVLQTGLGRQRRAEREEREREEIFEGSLHRW